LRKKGIKLFIQISLFIILFILIIHYLNCSHYIKNIPLTSAKQAMSYDFDSFNEPHDADEIFVVLTFSGGGTRAAALSYGVLKKIKDIKLSDTNRTLLDEVDIISTVSGGSFTGAYYALFRERIFEDYKERFLYRNIEKELALKLLNPYNLYRLASPYYSRIDMAAELYHTTIFDSETFATLAERAKRPFLIINATNMLQGARFEFTSDQFMYIGSDILSYPIARAVAASSAFPFLLSPISLFNYPYPEDYNMPTQDLMCLGHDAYWLNRRCYYSTYDKSIYAEKNAHPFLHLLDGGLADNLGLRAIYDLYVRYGIREKINNERIKRFLVIVVNAKTTTRETIDKSESPPGIIKVGHKTCTVSMDNYTLETIETFREMIDERIEAQRVLNDCQTLLDKHSIDGFQLPPLAGGNLKLYIADLNFDNLPEKEERDYFNNLPTSFKLGRCEVDSLIEVGGRLLVEHPEYKDFSNDFGTDK